MEKLSFNKITACLDMAGCPNRCKHCWLGVTPNVSLKKSDLEFVASIFRSYANNLEVTSWYREPDFRNDYKEFWKLEHWLSTEHMKHFELLSYWRIVRDSEYVKWIYSLGVRVCQLTIFGMEKMTDHYVGRKGAFEEILKSINILLENNIAPRLQIFINKDNVMELPLIEKLIAELDLDKRCKTIGQEFELFIHQGSCDGENEKLYNIRIMPEDVIKISPKLVEYTLKYFGKRDLFDVLGKTEEELFSELINDNSTMSFVSSSPIFYIDNTFNVYPNITHPASWWCLGNLKTDSVNAILDNYINSKTKAQSIINAMPIGQMIKKCGNSRSKRLFIKGDYITYIQNQFCEKQYGKDILFMDLL